MIRFILSDLRRLWAGAVVVVLLVSLAVALGVMLDTLIVRSVLVTALNLDLGGNMWWPSKLDSADVPLTEADAAAQRRGLAGGQRQQL